MKLIEVVLFKINLVVGEVIIRNLITSLAIYEREGGEMAELIRDRVPSLSNAALYRLKDGRYVVVSSPSEVHYETAIYLADENGEIRDWGTPLIRFGVRGDPRSDFSSILEQLEA